MSIPHMTTQTNLATDLVPSLLAEVIGRELMKQFFGAPILNYPTLLPPKRENCPEPEAIKRVPAKYRMLRNTETEHPGTGHGPGAIARNHALSVA